MNLAQIEEAKEYWDNKAVDVVDILKQFKDKKAGFLFINDPHINAPNTLCTASTFPHDLGAKAVNIIGSHLGELSFKPHPDFHETMEKHYPDSEYALILFDVDRPIRETALHGNIDKDRIADFLYVLKEALED